MRRSATSVACITGVVLLLGFARQAGAICGHPVYPYASTAKSSAQPNLGNPVCPPNGGPTGCSDCTNWYNPGTGDFECHCNARTSGGYHSCNAGNDPSCADCVVSDPC
jgi:hypothetical protein